MTSISPFCGSVSFSTSGRLAGDHHLWHDVEAVHLACAYHLPDVVRFSIGCACSAAGMALISVRITLAAACVAPLIGLLASVVGAYVTRLAREYREYVGVATAVANEGLSAARVVKSFGQEEAMAHRFGAAVDECAARSLREMAVHKCWVLEPQHGRCGMPHIAACGGHAACARRALRRRHCSIGSLWYRMRQQPRCDAANAYAKASASAAKGQRRWRCSMKSPLLQRRGGGVNGGGRSKARELFTLPGMAEAMINSFQTHLASRCTFTMCASLTRC